MLKETLIYLPGILGILLVGIFVLARSDKSVFRLYSLFSLFLSLWLFFQFLIDAQVSNGKLWLELGSVTLSALVFIIVLFLSLFPNGTKISNKLILVSLPILVFIPLSFTTLYVSQVTYSSSGADISSGPLLLIQTIVFVAYFLSSLINLIWRVRKFGKIQRTQIYLLFVALLIAILGSTLSGVIFPDSTYWQIARPLSFFIMIVIISYAMVFHRLFEIRSFVVRTIAYSLALIFAAAVYIVPTTLLISYLVHVKINAGGIILLTIIGLIVALIFQPLRKLFNQATNRIFFRDYYDPQEVLDKLSNLLVGSVEVQHIINGSTSIINDSINPRFIHFELLGGKINFKGGDELLKRLSNTEINMVVTDELDQTKDAVLYEDLHKHDIAVAVRLRTLKGDLGFIVLGYRQSGAIYNVGDKKLLSIATDEIAISLQNALRFEQIQKFNVTLQDKIEDATKQLTQANSRLKALDETKDDFISMASHQLRTPLSIIKGYVKMVSEGDAGKINSQQASFLDQALLSSESMVRLVSELLNISRITSGKFSIEEERVNLADIVSLQVSQLQNLAEEKNVKLTFEKPKDFPILMLDRDKIEQVIINFIDNAIHYSKEKGGKIEVQLTAKDDIEFKVIDNGIGVPENEKEHLFTKFYRANNARDVRPDGTGVGIYLAKVVVGEEGGKLIFESKEGEGSTFGFKFKKDKIVKEKEEAK